jgi:tetratricopeptide (TPR) repeat protein
MSSESPNRREHLNRGRLIRYSAQALVGLDSLDAARDLARQLYALEPSHGGLVRNRADQISANIANKESDFATALEILDRMKKAGTGGGGLFDITYRETRAEAYRLAGRYDDAVGTLKKLLHSYGWHSMAYLQLARIYQEMGKNAKAEEALVTFLDRWKDADEGLSDLEDARTRLAAIQDSRL